MKKYLVWKAGTETPREGRVIKAVDSFDARHDAARYYGGTWDKYCARAVPDAGDFAQRAIEHVSEVVHVAPPPARIKRCWVNQPAIGQKLHHCHGLNVLAAFGHEGHEVAIYFLEGPVVSIAGEYAACLSEGWK